MNDTTLTPLMQEMGKADEFKYPLITGVLAGLQKAGAPGLWIVAGLVLWVLFAITTKIGDAGQWPDGRKEWFFVLAPILFNGFFVLAAVIWGVEAPAGNGGGSG